MTRDIAFPRDNLIARVPCSAPAVAKEEEDVTSETTDTMQEEDVTVDFDVSEVNSNDVPEEDADMLVVAGEEDQEEEPKHDGARKNGGSRARQETA